MMQPVTPHDLAIGLGSGILGYLGKSLILVTLISPVFQSPIAQTILGSLIGGCFFLLGKRLEVYWRIKHGRTPEDTPADTRVGKA